MTNAIEILRHLDKSNCGECNERTCMAFAAAVSRGLRPITGCPRLKQDVLERYGGKPAEVRPSDWDGEEVLNRLKDRLTKINLARAADRLGVLHENDRLTLTVLGKNFSVDSNGKFFSEIHIHSWLTIPVLDYVLEGKGIEPSGQWVPFRELRGGKDWGRFFEHRCEKPMKKVADTYPDLFTDMLHVFSGKQVERHYESDISLVLHPLPKFPILICYWRPEDGLESDLHLFFDRTAEDNLPVESIYSLMTGLLIMFEKIAKRHN